MNREIVYERTVAGSYMKISAPEDEGLDERLILHRKLPGTLPVEKAYVDGKGQYWYNISGRQSLDMYCQVKEIGAELIEKLAVSLCSELEILDRNLVQGSCLVLDPEMIFIANVSQEFIFMLYPGNGTPAETGFRQLMEYLLTKISHRDQTAVRIAYSIYDITLTDGYSIMDVREAVMAARRQETKRETENSYIAPERTEDTGEKTSESEPKAPPVKKAGLRKNRLSKERAGKENSKSLWRRLFVSVKRALGYPTAPAAKRAEDQGGGRKRASRRPVLMHTPQEDSIVYPDEELILPQEEIHPTVCLSGGPGTLQGVLLYQGSGSQQDIRIVGDTVKIGYGGEADVRIADDTISQMHARIDREGSFYYIEDLNSTNGTYVNDELLAYRERRLLQVNDVVRFANLRYRFC